MAVNTKVLDTTHKESTYTELLLHTFIKYSDSPSTLMHTPISLAQLKVPVFFIKLDQTV